MVTQAEFEDSKDKVMMGAERKTMAMTEEEKLATAYHEAGHAIVNIVVPKATIRCIRSPSFRADVRSA